MKYRYMAKYHHLQSHKNQLMHSNNVYVDMIRNLQVEVSHILQISHQRDYITPTLRNSSHTHSCKLGKEYSAVCSDSKIGT